MAGVPAKLFIQLSSAREASASWGFQLSVQLSPVMSSSRSAARYQVGLSTSSPVRLESRSVSVGKDTRVSSRKSLRIQAVPLPSEKISDTPVSAPSASVR